MKVKTSPSNASPSVDSRSSDAERYGTKSGLKVVGNAAVALNRFLHGASPMALPMGANRHQASPSIMLREQPPYGGFGFRSHSSSAAAVLMSRREYGRGEVQRPDYLPQVQSGRLGAAQDGPQPGQRNQDPHELNLAM